ncbi:hypothetical protein CKW46_00640 [Mycobacterium liflandii]|nr:hypothetical protein MMSP_0369 [Mycobacterium sp. 012931]MBC9865570.1 hypothetical protein [Mycobacterium pseudoshottsii]ULL08591.1 hypothetical protein CKW46_00640 [Mycobacterium liflandii]GAQ32288.1 hypothetical protein MPS_0668 [Mycobacterium pseudoshottsii JCM 15466]
MPHSAYLLTYPGKRHHAVPVAPGRAQPAFDQRETATYAATRQCNSPMLSGSLAAAPHGRNEGSRCAW